MMDWCRKDLRRRNFHFTKVEMSLLIFDIYMIKYFCVEDLKNTCSAS